MKVSLKVLSVAVCSMILVGQAQAQSAARAARGAKEAPRTEAPAAGAAAGESAVGRATTVAPNAGKAGAVGATDILGKNGVGGSCGADLDSRTAAAVKSATLSGVTGGGCLAKFTGQARTMALEIVVSMNEQADRLGVKNAATADVRTKGSILAAGATVVEKGFKENRPAALDRLQQLCNNGCDVTGPALCQKDVFAAARQFDLIFFEVFVALNKD